MEGEKAEKGENRQREKEGRRDEAVNALTFISSRAFLLRWITSMEKVCTN